MADHDKGATVRLAATIARSRYESDGGTLLDGIHPDTIVEMALAAKREVDSLRADLARVTAERDLEANDRQTAGDAWNDMRRQRDAALVERAAAPRLLAALADECEWLRAENARLRDEVPTKAIDVLIGLLPATLYAQERNALSAVRLWLIGLSRLDAAKEGR